jgi:cell shape-determining protein MreD
MKYFLGFLLGLLYDLFTINLFGSSSIKIILFIFIFELLTKNFRLFRQKNN